MRLLAQFALARLIKRSHGCLQQSLDCSLNCGSGWAFEEDQGVVVIVNMSNLHPDARVCVVSGRLEWGTFSGGW